MKFPLRRNNKLFLYAVNLAQNQTSVSYGSLRSSYLHWVFLWLQYIWPIITIDLDVSELYFGQWALLSSCWWRRNTKIPHSSGKKCPPWGKYLSGSIWEWGQWIERKDDTQLWIQYSKLYTVRAAWLSNYHVKGATIADHHSLYLFIEFVWARVSLIFKSMYMYIWYVNQLWCVPLCRPAPCFCRVLAICLSPMFLTS